MTQPQPQPKDRRDPRVREIEAQIGALFAELKGLVQPTEEEIESVGQQYTDYSIHDLADNAETDEEYVRRHLDGVL